MLQFSLRHSRGGTPKHTHTVTDATQKETAIDQQQHSCEMLICQGHQTILMLLSSAATSSTRPVRELNCPTMYIYVHYKEYLLYSKILYNLFLIMQKREKWKKEIIESKNIWWRWMSYSFSQSNIQAAHSISNVILPVLFRYLFLFICKYIHISEMYILFNSTVLNSFLCRLTSLIIEKLH